MQVKHFKPSRWTRVLLLTMQKAVIFEASSTEQRVKRVHRFLRRHWFGIRTIKIWRALKHCCFFTCFCQILISESQDTQQTTRTNELHYKRRNIQANETKNQQHSTLTRPLAEAVVNERQTNSVHPDLQDTWDIPICWHIAWIIILDEPVKQCV